MKRKAVTRQSHRLTQKSRMMKACKDATITIYVKEGKDISPMDHDGLADPFCEVHINGKKKGKTSVCKNTLTPKWSPPAEFSFDVADLISGDQVAESIEIKVYDKDLLRREMVGVIDLPVDMSDLQEYKEDWYDILKDKDGSSKGEGKILIGVRVTDGRRKVTKDGGLPTEYMSMADDAQIIKRLTQQVDPVSLFLAMPRVMIVMKRKAQKAREAVELRNSSDYIPKKVKNESSERKQLNDRLELLGLTLKESEGDGNCQFRSFSFQLYGTQEHYKEIRKLICQWMRDHSESFSFYFNGDAEWQSYLKTMSRDREWGDELTLKAASDVLGANVHVVSSTLTNWYLTYTPDAQPQEQRKQIFLAYLSPVHYNSIILNKDAAAYSTPNTSKENLKDA